MCIKSQASSVVALYAGWDLFKDALEESFNNAAAEAAKVDSCAFLVELQPRVKIRNINGTKNRISKFRILALMKPKSELWIVLSFKELDFKLMFYF